jgi:uncharacterized membrane protein YphA (DoxX/SURF4 family)
MSTKLQLLFGPTRGPRSILLVRLAVSLIFFTQGILKYIDPNMGVVRFTRIGFHIRTSPLILSVHSRFCTASSY